MTTITEQVRAREAGWPLFLIGMLVGTILTHLSWLIAIVISIRNGSLK